MPVQPASPARMMMYASHCSSFPREFAYRFIRSFMRAILPRNRVDFVVRASFGELQGRFVDRILWASARSHGAG